jgi:hypothetical protein
VIFEVLRVVNIKIALFWVVMPLVWQMDTNDSQELSVPVFKVEEFDRYSR